VYVEINLLAFIVAAVAMFMVNGIWYGVVFSKLWAKIHGFDKLSDKDRKEAEKNGAIPMVLQFIVTALMSLGFAWLVGAQPNTLPFEIAFWVWLTFVVPPVVSLVLFGGTPTKSIVTKLSIVASGWFVSLMVAALVSTLL
jgi:hypothetical protein